MRESPDKIVAQRAEGVARARVAGCSRQAGPQKVMRKRSACSCAISLRLTLTGVHVHAWMAAADPTQSPIMGSCPAGTGLQAAGAAAQGEV